MGRDGAAAAMKEERKSRRPEPIVRHRLAPLGSRLKATLFKVPLMHTGKVVWCMRLYIRRDGGRRKIIEERKLTQLMEGLMFRHRLAPLGSRLKATLFKVPLMHNGKVVWCRRLYIHRDSGTRKIIEERKLTQLMEGLTLNPSSKVEGGEKKCDSGDPKKKAMGGDELSLLNQEFKGLELAQKDLQ